MIIQKTKYISCFIVIVLGLFPLYSYTISAILIGFVLGLNILINGIKHTSYSYIGAYVLYLLCISLLYTSWHEVNKTISSSYLLVFFPILFSSYEMNKSKILIFSNTYLVAIGVKSILLFYFFYTQNTYNIQDANLPFLSIHYHASYFFYEVLMAIYLCLFIVKFKARHILLLYFTFLVFMLQSKIGYLVFGINFLYFLVTLKKKSIAIGLFIFGLLFFYLSGFLYKTNYLIETYSNLSITNSDLERLHLLRAAWENFRQAPIFGNGIVEHAQFISKYFKDVEGFTYLSNYNTHNYFSYILASGGILGFILFVYPIYRLVKTIPVNFKDPLVFFLISSALLFSVENILSRYNGVVIFCVFLFLFYSFSVDSSNKNIDVLTKE